VQTASQAAAVGQHSTRGVATREEMGHRGCAPHLQLRGSRMQGPRDEGEVVDKLAVAVGGVRGVC
jgi:hypothetical protein